MILMEFTVHGDRVGSALIIALLWDRNSKSVHFPPLRKNYRYSIRKNS